MALPTTVWCLSDAHTDKGAAAKAIGTRARTPSPDQALEERLSRMYIRTALQRWRKGARRRRKCCLLWESAVTRCPDLVTWTTTTHKTRFLPCAAISFSCSLRSSGPGIPWSPLCLLSKEPDSQRMTTISPQLIRAGPTSGDPSVACGAADLDPWHNCRAGGWSAEPHRKHQCLEDGQWHIKATCVFILSLVAACNEKRGLLTMSLNSWNPGQDAFVIKARSIVADMMHTQKTDVLIALPCHAIYGNLGTPAKRLRSLGATSPAVRQVVGGIG